MKDMKRFLKLLCFVFITFFIAGFGGEKVFAQDMSYRSTWYNDGHWRAYVKSMNINNQDYYAFCLDSSKAVQYTNLTLDNSLYDYARDDVNKIISKAIELGLDISKLGSETTNQTKLYGVTQAAIWYAVHKNGVDGYTSKYQKWVKNNGMTTVFNQLIAAMNDQSDTTKSYGVGFHFNGSSANYRLSDDGQYWVLESGSYSIHFAGNVPNTTKATISSTNGEISIDNGNNWNSSISNVTVDSRILVRIPYDSSTTGNVSTELRVGEISIPAGYNTYFYRAGNNRQNIGLIVPNVAKFSAKKLIYVNYDISSSIEFQKLDKVTNERVAGAKIGLYTIDGDFIHEFESTSGTNPNPSTVLPVGEYYIKEIKAPKGYVLDSTEVPFKVVEDGTSAVTKDENNQVISVVSIYDKTLKVKFAKNQRINGSDSPIADVKIKVYNADTGKMLMCGITDSTGYFTRPCEGLEQYFSEDQLYDYVEGNYYIKEEYSPAGYYASDFLDQKNDFVLYNGRGRRLSSSVRVTGTGTEIHVTIMNENYIDISKSDMENGNEIPGAHMKLYDLEVEDNFRKSESDIEIVGIDKYVVLDEWVSEEGKSHRFVGIEPGHKYALVEELAPEGYVKLTTEIDFTMSKEGNVTILNKSESIDSDSMTSDAYKLNVFNDYTKVTISKTDMVTSEEVPGAHIKLCTIDEYNNSSNDCNAFEEWDSGDKPHEIDRLAVGEYCLIETIAPKGYAKKTSAVCFEVKEQSGIQQVEFKNQPIKMVVSKKNQITGERIAGATLQILNASDRSVAKTNTGAELTWVSSDTEDWEITGIPVGDYILVETLTPEGYQEGMVIDGEIVQEYSFTITGKEDVDIELYVPVMNAPNTGLSTLNLFAIGGLLIFTGYETIKIYRKKRVNA